MRVAVLLVATAGVAVGFARAEPPAREFPRVGGGTVRLPGPDDAAAVVLLFLGHDCPVSNGYTPELARIATAYTPKKVAFFAVYADADVTPDEAAKHAKEYALPCPSVLDPKLTLATRTGATVKPEAVVLSPTGDVLYRGRIDDRYIALGKKRAEPTTHDLRAALDAVLAGKPVPNPRTQAIGCDIDFPSPPKK